MIRENELQIDTWTTEEGAVSLQIEHLPTGIVRFHPGPHDSLHRSRNELLTEIEKELKERGPQQFIIDETSDPSG